MTSGRRSDGRGQRPAEPRIQIPENVSEFYSNSLNIGTTAWDFMLFFGSTAIPESIALQPGPVQGQIRVDAVVRMSPQHAKAAALALQRTVDEFEERFGEIHIPPPPTGETSENT